MITDEEKAELAKILGQNYTPAPATIAAAPEIGVPAPETCSPASALDETLSASATTEISNGSVPEMAAVERINGHIPELTQNQPDVSSLENGETPSTQPETGCQIEEEVVSGVVYIRLNSHVTTEPEIVPKICDSQQIVPEISDSQQIVPEMSDTVSEIAEKVPEIETVEVIIIEEQPPAKTVKKRKKKTSTGIIRNRGNKTKEVQTIQNIEQKLKGFE